MALDSSLRLLLVARSPDPQRPGCQRMSLYYSGINGYVWKPVTPPPASVGAACLADAWASATWVFAWWATETAPVPVTHLMRSGDLGATWGAADGGLPARDAYLTPALTSYGAGHALLAEVYYWPRHGRLNILRQVVHSLDDGATWETLSGGPMGLSLLASPEPREASAGAWGTLYSPVYTDAQLSPLWTPDQPPEGIQALATHTGVWRDLPPLPVNGAAAVDHLMGVALPLGVAPADALLTLGADPHHDVSAHPDARDLWLWAWDPAAGEWRLGEQAPPDARLVGFSWSAGPVGSPYEQDLWRLSLAHERRVAGARRSTARSSPSHRGSDTYAPTQDDSRHREGQMIRTVLATRYVAPLREGGSLPGLVEADDDGLYVLKFRGAGQGPRALIAELVAGEIGRALGLPVPEIVFIELDPALGRNEPDYEIRSLVLGSAGLNLGLDYLPGSLPYNVAAPFPIDADLASRIVWFDAYVTNIDRTPRNTNMLIWNHRLWLIDHGAALYFHHAWADYRERARTPFKAIAEHALLPLATRLRAVDAPLRALLTTRDPGGDCRADPRELAGRRATIRQRGGASRRLSGLPADPTRCGGRVRRGGGTCPCAARLTTPSSASCQRSSAANA